MTNCKSQPQNNNNGWFRDPTETSYTAAGSSCYGQFRQIFAKIPTVTRQRLSEASFASHFAVIWGILTFSCTLIDRVFIRRASQGRSIFCFLVLVERVILRPPGLAPPNVDCSGERLTGVPKSSGFGNTFWYNIMVKTCNIP
jgi:hypothetical protein